MAEATKTNTTFHIQIMARTAKRPLEPIAEEDDEKTEDDPSEDHEDKEEDDDEEEEEEEEEDENEGEEGDDDEEEEGEEGEEDEEDKTAREVLKPSSVAQIGQTWVMMGACGIFEHGGVSLAHVHHCQGLQRVKGSSSAPIWADSIR